MLEKRSFSLEGHRTSVALEPEFWAEVERISRERALSIAAYITSIDNARGEAPLASSLRLSVLRDLKDA
ncbi:MAG: ribbon-helix-helix domain-containing protein [Pseudomonadota bacterium]